MEYKPKTVEISLTKEEFEKLKTVLSTQDCCHQFKAKIEEILNTEIFDYNINEYVSAFTSFDENYLKGLSEFSSCCYVYLGKLIEFQIQKTKRNPRLQFQKLTLTKSRTTNRLQQFQFLQES